MIISTHDANASEPTEPAESVLPWLREVIGEALTLPAGEVPANAALVALGVTSMQAIALQYQILQRTGVDVAMEDLLGERTIAELAELVSDRMVAA